MKRRYDIISDTHGYLPPKLLDALKGADRIVHAGDICSPADLHSLEKIAPVSLALGNNDWAYDYGPYAKTNRVFFADSLRWQVNHFYEKLDFENFDVVICGHTHRPLLAYDDASATLIMNPGSPCYPRGGNKPSFGRIIIEDGQLSSAQILRLSDGAVIKQVLCSALH